MASLLRAFSALHGPDLCPRGLCSLMALGLRMVLKGHKLHGDTVSPAGLPQQQILTKDCSRGNNKQECRQVRQRQRPGSRVLPWAPGAQSHCRALGGDIEHRSELPFILQLTQALGACLPSTS